MTGVLAMMVGITTAAAAAAVNVPAGDYEDLKIDPADASGTISFNSGGTWVFVGSSGGSGTWLLSGAAADYDIRWTTTAGALTTGTAGTWQNLGTSRSFGVGRTTIGISSCTGTVEIRRVSDSVVIASGTITINASVDA